MGNLLGKGKTLKQIIREQKRTVDRSIRQLDRERAGLEKEEKKLIADIKKAAKANQMKSVRIMAKDLVRIRKHQEKFIGLTAQLRGLSLQMTSMGSTDVMQTSMKKITKTMTKLNKTIKLPTLQKVMTEFMKQSEAMEMKQEIMGDAVEDALDDMEDEEETDAIVGSVLDEIGIDLGDKMVDAPSSKQQEVELDASDKELEARLNNLKR